MTLLRNILTAIWCAIVIGTNVFGLILIARVVGLDAVLVQPMIAFTSLKMALLAVFGVMALVSTKYLWAILAVAGTALLLTMSYDLLIQRVWRPSGMLNALFFIIPTYLLARWNTLARPREFNPVKEF